MPVSGDEQGRRFVFLLFFTDEHSRKSISFLCVEFLSVLLSLWVKILLIVGPELVGFVDTLELFGSFFLVLHFQSERVDEHCLFVEQAVVLLNEADLVGPDGLDAVLCCQLSYLFWCDVGQVYKDSLTHVPDLQNFEGFWKTVRKLYLGDFDVPCCEHDGVLLDRSKHFTGVCFDHDVFSFLLLPFAVDSLEKQRDIGLFSLDFGRYPLALPVDLPFFWWCWFRSDKVSIPDGLSWDWG